jgi:hypothetical protein
MAAIPAEYLDLLQQKTAFAHLATIMPNGTPQVTPYGSNLDVDAGPSATKRRRAVALSNLAALLYSPRLGRPHHSESGSC